MWLHIAVALGLVPLLLWHLFTRPVRLRRLAGPRRGTCPGAAPCGSGC